MAHRLIPADEHPHLSVVAILRRLEGEFAHVDADPQTGADHVGGMLETLVRREAPVEVITFYTERQNRSFYVVVYDTEHPDAFLRFAVIPDDGIFIGYTSAQHEEASRPLLERCAHVLGYEINAL